MVDETGKLTGRGAYVHVLRSCWERAIKGPLARALKTIITPEDQDRLLAIIESVSEERTIEPVEDE
jgi:predicted RNA-binding protein YlxR (DUF448 family)